MKRTFTVFEVQTIVSILNMRTMGVGIRELRLIDTTTKTLEAKLPETPKAPEIGPAPEGGKHTQEQIDAFRKAVEEFNSTVQKLQDQELEFELSGDQLDLVKKRLEQFTGYFSDPDARAKTLALAEKVGL
jgi:hypothetical protein